MEKKSTNSIFRSLGTSPFKVALTYALVATLWIVSSSYLLPQTVSNPELQGLFEISKGLLFVLVTGALLYVLLRNWVPENKPQENSVALEYKLWNRVRIIPASFALVIFLPLLLLLIYTLSAPALEREGLARLQGEAKIQAIHIENWMNDREGDAKVLYHNRTLGEIVTTLQRTGSSKSRSIVTEYLQQIQITYNYESIILLDKDGNTLLTTGEHTTIPAVTMELIRKARSDGLIKHSHQFMLDAEHLHTDHIVPIIASQNKDASANAFIVMRAKLNDILTRTSQIKPGDTALDDVLLLHIDEERLVAFDTMTGAPHHTRERSKLQEHLPAVTALRSNQAGTTVTTDYLGKTVLAAWQPIAGTDWYILAKTDRSRVLAPIWNTLGWVVLVGTFLIAAIITLLHLLWKRQEYYQRLERLAHETQTDKLLKHFFDMPFVGMAIWSARKGTWIRFNDYLCDMLGYSREKMQKLKWEEISYKDDFPVEREKLQTILDRKADSYTMEKRLQRIDGNTIHTNVNVHCLLDEKGKPELFIATIQDITAYRRTIEALRESEERFHSIFDGALDGIVLADKCGAFITGNPAFCKMLGYTAEEVSSMSFRDIHPDDSLPYIETEFHQSASSKLNVTDDAPVLRKDGTVFTADIKGGVITVGDREYVMGIFRDTSERKTMLQALSDNEQRLRILINTIPDLVWLKDCEGVFLLCNASFERFFGASEKNIVGKTDYDFVDTELADFFREHDNIAMLAGEPSINEETVTYADDAHTAILETIKSPVTDSQGKLIGILGIGRDITQRKENEKKLQRLSQFYAALSQCNEAIIRSSDEIELLQEICRIAVQLTEISATWIGLINDDGRKVRWVAGYGDGNKEVASSCINLTQEIEIQNNPSHRAINQDSAVWIQNFAEEITSRSCLEIAATHDWHSVAALPLHRQGHVIGVLNLFANIENAFDDDVRRLLSEMADDISFALDNFLLEEKRHASERSLAESEERFRGLVEQSLAGIYIIQDNKYVYANPRMAEIFGFDSYKKLQGLAPTEFILPDDHAVVSEQISNVLRGREKHLTYEARVLRSDGAIIDIGVHGSLASHYGRPAIIGLVQDVTDKKLAETQLSNYVEKLQASLMQTVEVATILSEMRDPYTAGHERRVAEIAVAIGREMGLDEYALEGLRVAGHLHDIGKINIPSEILAKPGRLTELEYEIIKGHPQSGYNVLKDVDFPWPVAQVALQHHERINGSGYPGGLKGDEIMLEARITAVADVVEAMGSHRPYRPGLGIKPALEEIERGKGTLYDPQVAEACLRLFREKGYSLPA